MKLKGYWAPTPKKWRKLGDALLAVATIIAVGGLWQFDNLKEIFTAGEIKTMIVSSIVTGAVGKFLTNFFTEEPPEHVDYIISNPPYSLKHEVFERLFKMNISFAMLVGVVGLFESQKRFTMFKNNDFEIIIAGVKKKIATIQVE